MDNRMQKICVIGLGYIGLPTASLLATKGFDVLGVDVSKHVVDTINAGSIHIREPDLDVLVKSAVQSKRISAASKPSAADIFIIAVPTPVRDGNKPDLSHVAAAAHSIAPCLQPGNLVILESTSPVGTTERISQWLKEKRPDLNVPSRTPMKGMAAPASDIHIAYCPERVLPGQILRELIENDRVVGGIDTASTTAATTFYRSFVSGKVLETDSRTAELVKLSENTFRDVNIAFANELATVCDALGVDAWNLIKLANRHPRVNILRPGPGVGGHCIAVDPWFIVDSAPEQAKLIRAAREVNHEKPAQVVAKVIEVSRTTKNPTIACLGLAYKPDIDDLRESPAVEITENLAKQRNFRVLVVEPHISTLPKRLSRYGVELTGIKAALESSDVVVAIVAHSSFKEIKYPSLSGKYTVDACGLWQRSS